jgi:ATP-binding cassette subfamily B protein
VILIGGTILLWQKGAATPGDIAASGAISMRIAQMTGWVSFTLMTIYTSLARSRTGCARWPCRMRCPMRRAR